MQSNFRGIRNVTMVTVLEGTGTPESPFREVHYVYNLEQHTGSFGGLVGVIDPERRV